MQLLRCCRLLPTHRRCRGSAMDDGSFMKNLADILASLSRIILIYTEFIRKLTRIKDGLNDALARAFIKMIRFDV